ncbi:hypothetical protein M404DRAFT_917886 [Pisolithus tinctorius Marx 270]|uniref:Uncharacterized protein n=1 Tax=Pisolithus tinctorius Marx 270 TaxID=870435 RepID=A0A0C3N833_PISTI|nr:hypothetical protein M404DRAFT_917886 [Pisolithus tinctorius Marx 270]
MRQNGLPETHDNLQLTMHFSVSLKGKLDLPGAARGKPTESQGISNYLPVMMWNGATLNVTMDMWPHAMVGEDFPCTFNRKSHCPGSPVAGTEKWDRDRVDGGSKQL